MKQLILAALIAAHIPQDTIHHCKCPQPTRFTQRWGYPSQDSIPLWRKWDSARKRKEGRP